LDFKTPR